MDEITYVLGDNIGMVRLDGFYADDLSVVNSARVSLHKHHEMMELGDDKLIEFLMANKHGTPFEQNYFRFHVVAPIFVFREWHRHRIGVSINEMSGRYTELPEQFYVPLPENVRTQKGKPGHYTFEQADPEVAAAYIHALRLNCEDAFHTYRWMLHQGIAKEQARLVLPVNTYSEMYWSCNARSLMNFLTLRNSPKAQWEIRQYASVMEQILQEKMPVTGNAFVTNGRIAP
jgi:thymidylate synthase (FAD)